MSIDGVAGARRPRPRMAFSAWPPGAPPAISRLNSSEAAMWLRSAGVAPPSPPDSRRAAATDVPTASAMIPPIASMAITTTISTLDGDREKCVAALDLRLQRCLAQRGNGTVDVDLFVDANPAPAAAVCLRHLHIHRLRQTPRADGDDVDGLIGAELVARLERRAIHRHLRLQSMERVDVAHLPRAHDLGPMGDRHERWFAVARVVIVRGE